MKDTTKQLAKQLNKIAREVRLEQEAQSGRPVSKTWGGKESRRQERRKFKELANRMGQTPEKLQEEIG
jgi:hypothetical protein